MGDLDGKRALVTGGSRGIGRAICLELGRRGARVCVNYHTNATLAEEVVAELQAAGTDAYAVQGDVSAGESAGEVVKTAVEHLGGLDILVNNAGITRDGLLMRMSEDDWDAVHNTNLRGVFLVTKAAMRPLLRAQGGRIINISSVVGVMGNAGQANYAAAKAGIQGFTKTLAIELGKFGITTNCVGPGYIETDMLTLTAERMGITYEEFAARMIEGIPVGRVGQPDDIASAVSFFVREESAFVNGQVLYVAGGPVD